MKRIAAWFTDAGFNFFVSLLPVFFESANTQVDSGGILVTPILLAPNALKFLPIIYFNPV